MRRIAIRANIKAFDCNNTKVFKEIGGDTPEIGNRAIGTADRLEITTPIRIFKYKSVHNLWPNFKCVLTNAWTEPDLHLGGIGKFFQYSLKYPGHEASPTSMGSTYRVFASE